MKRAAKKFMRAPINLDPQEGLDPVLTVREVAELLKVHPSTIYRLLRQGNLPAFRMGSDWRFSLEKITKWSEDQVAAHIAAAKSKP